MSTPVRASDRDLRALAAIVSQDRPDLPDGEGLPPSLLADLQDQIRCDRVLFNLFKRMLDPNFVLDESARERLVTRYGTEVDAWCAALPEMVERYCLRWHLELYKALSGNSSRVFIGRQHGNRGVILKLTPDRSIANQESIALRAWAATPHAADLLEADLDAGAMLLEHIEPSTKVSDEPRVPPVNEVAELLTGLRETVNYDAGQLPTMAQGMESMFSRIGGLLSNPQVSAVAGRQVLDDGYDRARELASNGPKGLLHGDLHLSNILRAGPGRGLVAIDPRPSVGDLTFDAIDWALDRVISIAEVHERIERLSKLVPELDPDRLWGWCRATAAALAILRLCRRPPDATTQLLLEIAGHRPQLALRIRPGRTRQGRGSGHHPLRQGNRGRASSSAGY